MLDKEDINEFKQQMLVDFNSRTNYDNKGSFHPRVANRLIELAPLRSGQKVLDVATGTGNVAIAAAKIVGSSGQVIGVDIASGMLNQAKQKIEAAGLNNIELMEADVEHLSFSDRSFDAILCSLAICYLTDIPAALRQWYRWLKTDGFVAFNCWAETAFTPSVLFRAVAQRYGIKVPNPNEPLGTIDRCDKLLKEAGFTDIDIKTEQFGWYYTPDASYAESLWNINSKNPFGFQINQLSPEKLEQFKAEYFADLETEQTTEQGNWCDATAFFVLARK